MQHTEWLEGEVPYLQGVKKNITEEVYEQDLEGRIVYQAENQGKAFSAEGIHMQRQRSPEFGV